MLRRMSRTRVVGFWFAAVAVVIASVAFAGVSMVPSTIALLLTMCLVPPAIVLAVWRGAPQPTVGELLYAVNKHK